MDLTTQRHATHMTYIGPKGNSVTARSCPLADIEHKMATSGGANASRISAWNQYSGFFNRSLQCIRSGLEYRQPVSASESNPTYCIYVCNKLYSTLHTTFHFIGTASHKKV